MGRDNLESKEISVNEFLKRMKKSFKNFEYKATSKEGNVYKSKNWDKVNK